MTSSQILLTELQYCHVIDNNSGKIRLIEGSYRGSLESHEAVYGDLKKKVNLKENQYILIDNPYDKEKSKNKYGDRVSIIGPSIFSLYPGEEIVEKKIYDATVLTEEEAIYITAVKNFDDNGTERKAGDIWMIQGPIYYIPNKYAKIFKKIIAMALGDFQGVYIQNIKTGDIRLEKGPKLILLTPFEKLYKRTHPLYSTESSKTDLDNLKESELAPVLWIFDNQASLIINNNYQRVVFGPNHIILEPFEKPYVMSISGGTPKITGTHRIWKLKLGPDFMTDILEIRTKDNAELKVTVRYKWRFIVDKDHPEKLFSIKDFIGYTSETLAGIIRNVAAKYNFEEFHTNGAELIKENIFKDGPFRIDDNGFEVFHIDLKKMVPVDKEIAQQLNSAIKSNMDVYVKKIRQEAEIDAKKAEVRGLIQIQEEKKKLNVLELENEKLLTLGKADIRAEAILKEADANAKAKKLTARAMGDAENEILQDKLNILECGAAEFLVKLEQAQNFNTANKTIIVPTDSKVILGNEVLGL